MGGMVGTVVDVTSEGAGSDRGMEVGHSDLVAWKGNKATGNAAYMRGAPAPSRSRSGVSHGSRLATRVLGEAAVVHQERLCGL